MPPYRAPRGTRDLLPEVRARLSRLESVARSLAARYGYREMEIPLFEQTAVFERGMGDPALLQRPDQRLLVDGGAAAGVDEDGALLHLLEVLLAEHVMYLGPRR